MAPRPAITATFLATAAAADHVGRTLAPLLHDTRRTRLRPGWDPADLAITEGERSITLTRGGFGGRPAYVRRLPEVTLVSSSMAWMVAASKALGAAVTLDPDVLAARVFYLHAPDATRSLFREIATVAAGTRVEVLRDRVTASRLEAPLAITMTALLPVEELRARLSAAVDRATRGADRVAVMTGGGVDSSALLALSHARTPVNAFAIDFAGPGDDRPHLATLARALSLEPHRLSPSDAMLPNELTADALPLLWPSAAAEATLLSRARTWGADRALCGLFADALFDVAPATWKRRLRASVVGWLPPSVVRMARKARHARGEPIAFAGPRLTRLRRERAAKPELAADPRDPAERLRSAFFSRHLEDAAELRAQEEALSGMTRVDPYLDAALAVYVLSLPREVVAAGAELGVSRGLFRAALAGVLPESIRTRPDKASFAPLHAALFRAPLAGALLRYGSFEALADLGIVDAAKARSALLRATQGEADAARFGADLYPLLVAEHFVRAHRAHRAHRV